jgi:nucleoside-triphosphatase
LPFLFVLPFKRNRGGHAGRFFSQSALELCYVTKKILLTGRPGCGKTTLVQRIVNDLALPAGGFYTKEIRERGVRVGFKLITLDGKEGIFANINFKTSERVGKYGLDLAKLETVGVAAVREAVRTRKLVVIDEIGPMELRSAIFRDVISEAFETTVSILATITARPFPFTNAIKKRPDVRVVDVRPNNRERLFVEMSDQFKT